uniref:Trafficking protein particle complex subunit 6B-like n=2 Tax=Hirondellea gigas TaxID=1518452 RepID=A0A6A7FN68_9CRUS
MTKVAEDVLFDFLHMESVRLLYDKQDNEKFSEDEVTSKLEHMGFSTGYRLAERLSRESLRFSDELELLKYVCKVVWSAVYRKEVDNLRTNHQGFYVLHDNCFRFFAAMSRGKQYLQQAPKYLSFPCGVVRGALANLGVQCVVTAEVTGLPACKFQVQVQRG